jgi:DNA-binding beta-propeller fold protein YncE
MGVVLAFGGAARAVSPPRLFQPAAAAGCVRTDGKEGCGWSKSLDRPTKIVVSPDGRNVYVASQLSLTTFARSADGALKEIGCFSAPSQAKSLPRCTIVRDLAPTDVEVSPDGRSVYVSSSLEDFRSGTYFARVIVFARSSPTGRLSQLPGRAGCVASPKLGAAHGCVAGRGLDYPSAIAVAPDGKFVYVSGGGGLTVFSRARSNGALRQLSGSQGCLLAASSDPSCAHRAAIEDWTGPIAISPNGRMLLALEEVNNPKHFDPANALLVFRRNASNGALQQMPGRDGCVVAEGHALNGCALGPGLEGAHTQFSLVVSPDGRNAYVGGVITIAAFSIDAGSGIRQAECLSLAGSGSASCAGLKGSAPLISLATAPNNRTLYFTYEFGTNGGSGRLFALERNPQTGDLREVTGGCWGAQQVGHGCGGVRGFHGPTSIATSPDGSDLYAAGFFQAGNSFVDVSEVAVLTTREP